MKITVKFKETEINEHNGDIVVSIPKETEVIIDDSQGGVITVTRDIIMVINEIFKNIKDK